MINLIEGEVHTDANLAGFDFVQVFGTSNEELQLLSRKVEKNLNKDGLFWIFYPKKSLEKYKGSNCSRETVAALLSF